MINPLNIAKNYVLYGVWSFPKLKNISDNWNQILLENFKSIKKSKCCLSNKVIWNLCRAVKFVTEQMANKK